MKEQSIELVILPKDVADESKILKLVQSKWKDVQNFDQIRIDKRSIDARGKRPKFRLRIVRSQTENQKIVNASPPNILASSSPICHIIGAGPAGYFAALECLKQGIKPIVYDRGKNVRERRRDLRAIQQDSEVNPHSNYCFGEGGAGTYSDGKLYTRSHKRGKIADILQTFVEHGAPTDILIDAHPHIGSNKLPKIVENLRETILESGGEIHFNSQLTDIALRDGTIDKLVFQNSEVLRPEAVILATGHSARDIFELLDKHKIELEFKPFAMGVRVEHPQALIDQIQYNQKNREENLPASSYRLACTFDDVGVYSFCMCPGGLIVPASTAPKELVVNGMSLSRRDSPFANAGTVVSIDLPTLNKLGYEGIFAGINFQRDVEQKIWAHGDGSLKAPAQRLNDFMNEKITSQPMTSSYIPGLYGARLDQLLPRFITDNLKKGIKQFTKKMKGYDSQDAILIGLESRTSSPIRIPRQRDTNVHPNVNNLFPCGEGAGYAGGILSATIDGINVARSVALKIKR